MSMKCNMCSEGDMEHQFVITNRGTKEITILLPGTEAYGGMAYHVRHVNSTRTVDNDIITHIYNCTACPNSQLEFYQDYDAEAYLAAMTSKVNY